MQEDGYNRKVHASIASSIDPTVDIITRNLDLQPFRLDSVQALHVAIILEDLFDQLEILGNSTGVPLVDLKIWPSFEDQLRNKHGTWMDAQDPGSPTKSKTQQETVFQVKHQYISRIPNMLFETYFPKMSRIERRFTELIKKSGIKTDTAAAKLQTDKAFIQWSIQLVIEDLLKHNSYEALKTAVEGEQEKKKYMSEMFKKIIQDTERMKQMKIDIKRAKKEKIREVQILDAQIFEARDNLLEMNFRKPLEAAYTQKMGKATIARVRKMCLKAEKEVGDRLKEAKFSLANESKCHDSMVRIIKAKMKATKSVYDYWLDKYDKDTSRLQIELDEIKAERARDLARIAYLRKMIDDYEEIVQDDRRVKTKQANRVLKIERDNKNATRLQAWWRGTMVRNGIGRFKTLLVDLIDRKKKPEKKK